MPTLYHNSSIHRLPNGTLGKVGGFFKFPGTPGIYGVSNNHVIANLNNCNPGDAIAGQDGNVIGSLYSWIELDLDGNNTIDMAFMKMDDTVTPAWNMPKHLTKPNGFVPALVNGHVYMTNNEREASTGYIKELMPKPVKFGINGISISYASLYEVVSFDGKPFSFPGDSGSVIFSSNDKIVGLLVGGKDNSGSSFFVPFSTIIKKYLIEIY